MQIVLRSKLGLGLAAIHDSDRTAASSGVDVFRLKLHAFVIAAFVIGAAGAIFLYLPGIYIASRCLQYQMTNDSTTRYRHRWHED